MSQQQLNHRGYPVNGGRKKPGPKPGSTRKSALLQKVDWVEKDLARRVRESEYGWTADQIHSAFITGCNKLGATDYYAVRAGLGTRVISSWRCKWESRFGLRSCPVQMQHRSRKGGEQIYEGILKSWTRFDEIVRQALDDGGERRLLFLGNMDETSMGLLREHAHCQ